ncbi:replication-associated recombination protein A [Kamptonema cortianum]|nr:replication-associated recombination protein A [Geitlerinema splendidum]MDK3160980.1 replication-associated recombination protein A [Kamptonema cortianum]
MRPASLQDYVGQSHLLAEGMPVRLAIESGRLGSVVLWAPPGCGKTTLAFIIAAHMDAKLEAVSAVTAGVADIRRIAQAAKDLRSFDGKSTVLLVDEIHHFNKSQQDSLLGYLEDGTLTMIGATTENPFFVLNNALLSRARVLPLRALDSEDIKNLLHRALKDEQQGIGQQNVSLDSEAEQHIMSAANGDARLALNYLETAALMTPNRGTISLETVEQVIQKPAVRYDRQGDYHYDTISAFIKSVRGSDSDAALHYLARMLEAGEDPRFIVRRLMVLASEDIGNAEPQGLVLAAAAAQVVERLGMPEARITLAQLTTFLSEAPKSNKAYLAVDRAIEDVKQGMIQPIPMHLRNAPMEGLKELGHGEHYQYPHDFDDAWVDAEYLPDGADLSVPYYEPSPRGYEARMRERRANRAKKSD